MMLVVEMHNGRLSDTAEGCLRLIDGVDRSNFRMNFQPMYHDTPEEMMETLRQVATYGPAAGRRASRSCAHAPPLRACAGSAPGRGRRRSRGVVATRPAARAAATRDGSTGERARARRAVSRAPPRLPPHTWRHRSSRELGQLLLATSSVAPGERGPARAAPSCRRRGRRRSGSGSHGALVW